MAGMRTVRPRPLDVEERVPVFWAGREVPAQIKAIDRGALHQYLVASTPKSPTPKTGKKRRRTVRYQAPREVLLDSEGEEGGGVGQQQQPQKQQQGQQKSQKEPPGIHVPRVRPVADYHLNRQALQPKSTFTAAPGGSLAVPYVRWRPPLPGVYDDDENQPPPEYDMDEHDEAWLERINSGESAGAAAREGSGRAAEGAAGGSSGGGHGAGGSVLSVVAFERAIDQLELLHFEVVGKWWSDLNEGPSTSAPTYAPKIPATKQLLTKARAMEEVTQLVPDPAVAGQLYDHWLRRRQHYGGPLLGRLWFEVPWKFVAFAHLLGEEEGDDEQLPFMAREPRSVKRRGGGGRRRLNDGEALEALQDLREELETVRTLVDRVLKREKLKRSQLLTWRREWQLRMQVCSSFPLPAPRPKHDSRELLHWGHCIGHPLSRGAVPSRAPSRAPSRPLTPALNDELEEAAEAAIAAAEAQQRREQEQQLWQALEEQRRQQKEEQRQRREQRKQRRDAAAATAAAAAAAGGAPTAAAAAAAAAPAAAFDGEEVQVVRRRGRRPREGAEAAVPAAAAVTSTPTGAADGVQQQGVPKRRGRPPRTPTSAAAATGGKREEVSEATTHRGRPSRAAAVAAIAGIHASVLADTMEDIGTPTLWGITCGVQHGLPGVPLGAGAGDGGGRAVGTCRAAAPGAHHPAADRRTRAGCVTFADSAAVTAAAGRAGGGKGAKQQQEEGCGWRARGRGRGRGAGRSAAARVRSARPSASGAFMQQRSGEGRKDVGHEERELAPPVKRRRVGALDGGASKVTGWSVVATRQQQRQLEEQQRNGQQHKQQRVGQRNSRGHQQLQHEGQELCKQQDRNHRHQQREQQGELLQHQDEQRQQQEQQPPRAQHRQRLPLRPSQHVVLTPPNKRISSKPITRAEEALLKSTAAAAAAGTRGLRSHPAGFESRIVPATRSGKKQPGRQAAAKVVLAARLRSRGSSAVQRQQHAVGGARTRGQEQQQQWEQRVGGRGQVRKQAKRKADEQEDDEQVYWDPEAEGKAASSSSDEEEQEEEQEAASGTESDEGSTLDFSPSSSGGSDDTDSSAGIDSSEEDTDQEELQPKRQRRRGVQRRPRGAAIGTRLRTTAASALPASNTRAAAAAAAAAAAKISAGRSSQPDTHNHRDAKHGESVARRDGASSDVAVVRSASATEQLAAVAAAVRSTAMRVRSGMRAWAGAPARQRQARPGGGGGGAAAARSPLRPARGVGKRELRGLGLSTLFNLGTFWTQT